MVEERLADSEKDFFLQNVNRCKVLQNNKRSLD